MRKSNERDLVSHLPDGFGVVVETAKNGSCRRLGMPSDNMNTLKVHQMVVEVDSSCVHIADAREDEK